MTSAYRTFTVVALTFASALLGGRTDAHAKNTRLQFDGFYRCSIPTSAGPMTSYLRFYSDGVVVASITPGTIADVAKWLNRAKQPNFHYRVRGTALRFEEDLEGLSYIYSGTIRDDSLALRVDGYKQKEPMGYVERVYKFTRVSAALH